MSWLWRRMKRIRMILMIAGILKGDECLHRNTSGNVKIANLLKTIPEIKNFELNEDNSGIVFRRLVIFTSPTFYSLSTSVALFFKVFFK
jgi:hypothetical protein